MPGIAMTNGSHANGVHQSNGGHDRPRVVLVTGGSGLVGTGLRYVVKTEAVGSRYGKQTAEEQWIFLSSKDGDLR